MFQGDLNQGSFHERSFFIVFSFISLFHSFFFDSLFFFWFLFQHFLLSLRSSFFWLSIYLSSLFSTFFYALAHFYFFYGVSSTSFGTLIFQICLPASGFWPLIAREEISLRLCPTVMRVILGWDIEENYQAQRGDYR